jgi:hypothetical protein
VERTITDPTLVQALTRSFKEAAKYRKKKRFIIPYSFEEDVMTAINPPKQNTSGQFEVNFDGFTASTHHPKN